MKHGISAMRTVFMSLLFALIGACSLSESADTRGSGKIDQWIATHVTKDDKLLCQRDAEGEYYFLAMGAAADKVKVGARIDVTGKKIPLTTIVAWHFKNEKGEHVTVKTPPNTVTGGYVKDNGRMFSEDIEYQTLNLLGSAKLRASVEIKKCPTADDCERQKKSKDEKHYTIKLCEVPLNKQ